MSRKPSSLAQVRQLETLRNHTGAKQVATVYYCPTCPLFEWVQGGARRKQYCKCTIGRSHWEFIYLKEGKYYRSPGS